jgi:hypothetical protein
MERKMIRKIGNEYKVLSHDGKKVLGTYSTEEEAKKRLQQIELFKHINAALDKKKK